MNNDFELPILKKNDEEDNKVQQQEQNTSSNETEKIEIPQEYYDKLTKEKEERLQELAKKEEEHQMSVQSGGTIGLIILSFIFLFGLLYGMVHFNKLLILGIPLYVVLGTIVSSASKKENSKFPVSILVSCMIGALVSFILAMKDKNTADKYIYYAYGLFIIAFLGYVLALSLVKLLFDKNVKALGKIASLIIIVLILGGPYYLYTNYKADFITYVFREKTVVGAVTEQEYIERVLKNRYDYKFICDGTKKNYIDDLTHRRLSVIQCRGDNDVKLEVMSLYYDEDNKQYIVRDSYLDTTYINPLRKELESSIKGAILSSSVKIGLYPDSKCYFIGDCKNNSNYEKETDLDTLHKYSDELRLQEYIGIDSVEFFNRYGFEYEVVVRGNYSSETNFENMVESITTILEQKGIKNKKGFTITIKDSSVLEDVCIATGEADSSGSFKNFKIKNG